MSSTAVVFGYYGEPDVLELTDVPVPEPEDGEVRVRVRAAGVQPLDSMFRSGAAHHFRPATFPQRLGDDLAGVVDAVGDGVDGFAVGDEVLGWAKRSAYAHHVVVGVDQLVAKPTTMPWEEAGVLSASGQAASAALEQLGVVGGDTVLIHGAAGGVGVFAVQIAVAWGATVVGTASPANHDFLRDLGAVPVAYGDGLTDRVREAAPGGVKAALDVAGTVDALLTSIEVVAEGHRIGTLASQPVASEAGIRRVNVQRSTTRLQGLLTMYTDGKLRVFIHASYPLTEVAAAHEELDTGHVRGKIVLTL